MALNCGLSTTFTSFTVYSSNAIARSHHTIRPFKTIVPSLPAAVHSTLSPSEPIFLPFLEQYKEDEQEEKQTEDVDDGNKVTIADPIHQFFKSRSEIQENVDPRDEGRFRLQKNRKSSWKVSDMDEEIDDEFESPVEASESETRVIKLEQEDGEDREILQIARNLPENSTLDEFLGNYVGKLTAKACITLLGKMEEEGLIMSCLYLFDWMRSQEPSMVTPRAVSVLFPILGRAGMGDQLIILYNNLPTTKEFRDLHVYNSTISSLSCCGRYDDAWKVYETMETNNIMPDHVTCSILITIMRKSGQTAKDAWRFFEKMNRKGVPWKLEVIGALIKSFCDEGLKNEALIIQSEMEKKGIKSNTIIYNTLMDAYGKSNQVEEAEGLFLEMKEKSLKPTVSTYNILMDAYSRRMQPEIIESLMSEMQDLGLEPNVKSYTSLISAYGKQKKMSEKAADAFLRMKKLGIKPTSHSYTALIHAYSLGGWHEKAYATFENMKRERVKPSIETYTALLDAFRRAGDTKTLMEIWKSMIKDKIEGTRVTFNILLDGLAKQGHYVEARNVIFEFGKLGLQPTVMTYNMLLNAYARGGQQSKMPQLLKEMAALKLIPDSVSYSTMIYAYVRVRDFSRAIFYHKQMVKSKQVPDEKSYKKLRAILDVKAARKNIKDRSAILGIINSNFGLSKPRKGKKDEFWKYKKRGLSINRTLASRH